VLICASLLFLGRAWRLLLVWLSYLAAQEGGKITYVLPV
jgi:hypothetical protein